MLHCCCERAHWTAHSGSCGSAEQARWLMLGGAKQGHPTIGEQSIWHYAGEAAQAPGSAAADRSGTRSSIAGGIRWGLAGFLLGAGFWAYLGVRALTSV